MAFLPYDPSYSREASKSTYSKRRARKTVNRKKWKVISLPDGRAAGTRRTPKRAVARRYGT